MEPISLAAIQKLVADNQREITSGLAKGVKELWKSGKVRFGAAFETYLKNANEKYSKAKTLLSSGGPRYLYDFFVPGYVGNRVSRFAEMRLIDPVNVNNLLAVSRFLIIQGSGGMGKSTLMRHLFLDGIKRSGLIPIFIELRDFNRMDSGKEHVFSLLYRSMARLGFDLEEAHLGQALKSDRFLILLDGFDEVSQDKADALLRDIDELCDNYPHNHYILFSRPSQSFHQLHRFTTLECQPFPQERAVEMASKIDFDTDLRDSFVKELDEHLYKRHRSFASNPLLLNIMLLTYDSYAEIPEKVHIFYEKAFDTMYSRHDAFKGLRREKRCELAPDDFKRVFSAFCYRGYIKNQLEFSRRELLDTLSSCRSEPFSVENMVHDLESVACVLYEDGEVYHFTHRSFQEYFTAYFIREMGDREQTAICMKLLQDKSGSTFTLSRENDAAKKGGVFDLLMDMMPQRFEQNVLIPILELLEETIGPAEDRYRTLLPLLVNRVVFFPLFPSTTAPSEIDIIILEGSSISAFSILNRYAEKILDKQLVSFPVHPYIKRITPVLSQHANDSFALYTKSIADIMRQPMVYDCIKKSTIGEQVRIVSGLLEQLTEKYHRAEALRTKELEAFAVF